MPNTVRRHFPSPTATRRRDAILARLLAVHKIAHEAVRLRDAVPDLQRRLRELNTSAESLASATIRQQAQHWVIAAGYLPLIVADLTLSAPTFEYYSSTYLRLEGAWLTVAMLAGPLVVFFMELSIAAQRTDYLDTLLVDRPAYRALTAAGVTLAVVMAGMVYATQVARFVATPSATATQVFWLRAYAMAALALVVHLAVALAGRAPAEAKAYVAYACRRWLLENRIRVTARDAARRVDEVWELFTAYQAELDRFGSDFPTTRLESGPFDRTTADLVKARAQSPANPADAGDDVSPAATTPVDPDLGPQTADVTAAAETSEAPPTVGGETSPTRNDGGDNAELQYYQSILRDRVREAEREVRP